MITTVEEHSQRYEQSLAACPEAIAAVRHIVRVVLRLWGRTDLSYDVTLCLTELLTNVIKHAACSECLISLQDRPIGLRVAVADTDPAPPVVRHPDHLSETGRGMALIERTAHRWGVEWTLSGKRVWAEFRTARPAAVGA
ncbi:ATP-binding protein [Streptomyces sp. B1866]|uniref:ATP-binding protein n=1 Tax=Streptomyces sp. B1866 TaxID=3075431 RepID=UPI0028902AE1|nr:ATP-binding protein [Streptomyces sp. B1866]MDT3396272.1 ATP-binding protein [Streptomyces sp. B1866]